MEFLESKTIPTSPTFMHTRRQFLRDCSMVAAAAALVPAAALARNPAPQALAAVGPGLAQFARHVNTPFILQTGSKMIKLLLVEASSFSGATADGEDAGNEKFSLLFRGSLATPLVQDTYSFFHPRLGQFSIVIVPICCLDTKSIYYEAIFDRPVNSAELADQMARAPRRVAMTEPLG